MTIFVQIYYLITLLKYANLAFSVEVQINKRIDE